MYICRRVFLVPLADGDHGKTSIVRSLVNQGQGSSLERNKKSQRSLVSPHGRTIDAYIFGRSFQETERRERETVVAALDASDPDWRKRELIIMPSHTYRPSDCAEMVNAAHSAGFDAVVAAVLLHDLSPDDADKRAPIWHLNWDERWTIANYETGDWQGQTDALGRDLWALVCRTMLA